MYRINSRKKKKTKQESFRNIETSLGQKMLIYGNGLFSRLKLGTQNSLIKRKEIRLSLSNYYQL